MVVPASDWSVPQSWVPFSPLLPPQLCRGWSSEQPLSGKTLLWSLSAFRYLPQTTVPLTPPGIFAAALLLRPSFPYHVLALWTPGNILGEMIFIFPQPCFTQRGISPLFEGTQTQVVEGKDVAGSHSVNWPGQGALAGGRVHSTSSLWPCADNGSTVVAGGVV